MRKTKLEIKSLISAMALGSNSNTIAKAFNMTNAGDILDNPHTKMIIRSRRGVFKSFDIKIAMDNKNPKVAGSSKNPEFRQKMLNELNEKNNPKF